MFRLVLVSLLFLFPAMRSDGGPAAGKTIRVIGHRGARALRPENTLPAFKYAIAAGADSIAMEMSVTKDNIVVLSNAPVLKPPVCSGPRPEAVLRELTFAELSQWDCGSERNPDFPHREIVPGTHIPDLDSALALASQGAFDFNLEPKISAAKPEYSPDPEEFARLVLASIRKHHVEKRVVLQCFDFRPLIAMKKLAPEIRLSAMTRTSEGGFEAIAKQAGAGIISPDAKIVTAGNVSAAHAAGLQVMPWTTNTPAEWDRLIAAGVDGIITDDPAGLADYLKKRGLR